jgi:FKBP-type peptidyl-prolyl cis-trans isomerase FklB
MKLRMGIVLCAVLVTTQVAAAEEQELKTQKERISYVVGLEMANNLKKNMIDLDVETLVRGVKDALSGAKPLMTEQERKETIVALQNELQAKQQELTKAIAEKNKKEGEDFLAENKKKQGVITMPSGLQYKILADGKGKSPKATDAVSVNYRGMLVDGTEFDSSYKRGQPETFVVNRIIPGWTEALQLMKTGSKWQLFIPPDLAYGERGTGGPIGPNAVLIFEVELISIK